MSLTSVDPAMCALRSRESNEQCFPPPPLLLSFSCLDSGLQGFVCGQNALESFICANDVVQIAAPASPHHLWDMSCTSHPVVSHTTLTASLQPLFTSQCCCCHLSLPRPCAQLFACHTVCLFVCSLSRYLKRKWQRPEWDYQNLINFQEN